MHRLSACLAGVLMLATGILGCQRATRYPAVGISAAAREEKKDAAPAHWSWHLPEGWLAPPDVPIVFVAADQPNWRQLPSFWNHFPPPAAGARTIHLGQAPIAIAAAMTMADRLESVRIKVPLGLPDPTPRVPPANPMTFGKWKLGRQIFFDRKLTAGSDTFSCASCHKPLFGFAEDRSVTLGGIRNTMSLLNTVFNRHQFWDGRAAFLEEVLVRSLDDERPPEDKNARQRPQETHRWGGLMLALSNNPDYRLRFKLVFGNEQPTQDAIAKALATYVRTILSGNSIVDRAEQERRNRKAPELLAEHFAPFLENWLPASGEVKEAVAKKLELGQRLFQSKGCAVCHSGPLFTDQDFHNVGVGESERFRKPGEETGRFSQVPIGLKELRLIGAFRTPTLRALPRTGPYFHDGSAPDLRAAVSYFNQGVRGNRYLAQALSRDADGNAQALAMTDEQIDAVVLFLRALDGDPVDGIVAAAPP